MSITVKNIHTGGDRKPPSGYTSWLDYWMKKKGVTSTPNCANLDCSKKAVHGGHVKKVNSEDNSWYIVPQCASCNEDKDLQFAVNSGDLVPVND